MQVMVYWDTHTPWMASLKPTKLNVKGFAIHMKVKHYTTTCSSTQRSWLHIQYIHQSDIHLGIYWWKVLLWHYFTLHKGKPCTNAPKHESKTEAGFLLLPVSIWYFCFTLLMSHFHIRVLMSTTDKQWKCENDTVPVDLLLSLLKCCTCLCTYRALMICTASNIGS